MLSSANIVSILINGLLLIVKSDNDEIYSSAISLDFVDVMMLCCQLINATNLGQIDSGNYTVTHKETDIKNNNIFFNI